MTDPNNIPLGQERPFVFRQTDGEIVTLTVDELFVGLCEVFKRIADERTSDSDEPEVISMFRFIEDVVEAPPESLRWLFWMMGEALDEMN